jgi:putative ABC transport system permease protein
VIDIALSTLRVRWVAFTGTLVAMALGVGLISSIALVMVSALNVPERAPERFAAAPVVVSPAHTLTVTTDSGPQSNPLSTPAGLPADLLTRLSSAAHVLPDRTFYAQVAGGPARQVGHGWSSASFAARRLVAGHAPVASTDIVVDGGTPGSRVTVLTAAGPRDYRVTGVTAPVPFESAVFFTDIEAARISPPVDAAVAEGPADAIRAAVGDRADVLTSDARRELDPQTAVDHQAVTNMNTLLGVSGGIAAFVAIFVVAATFAFAVAQRRQEFALLRTVGALSSQVRRMVVVEAVVIGAAGSAAGCLLGRFGATLLAGWLDRLGIAPSWLTVSTSVPALAASFALGVGVALLGVWLASARAGRVPAIEALRDAVVDTTPMTRGRWVFGLGSLFCALALMFWVARSNPGIATVPMIYFGVLMLIVVAVALLAPLLIGVVARVVTWPFTILRSAGGMLTRANTLTAARRTAATATPVLLVVGLAFSLLGAVSTTNQAKSTEVDTQLRADYVVVPDGTPGLSRAVTDRLAAVPGATAVAQVPTTVYAQDDHATLRPYHARAVTPAALPDVLDLPLAAGSPAALSDDTIIVGAGWGRHVGQSVRLWLADGHEVTLRVAGVLKDGVAASDAYLTSAYAGRHLADAVYVTVRPGTSASALTEAVHGLGATVRSRAAFVDAADTDSFRSASVGLLVTLVIVAIYSSIAIINTMVMAAAGRRRELASLRLAGATPRQVLWLVAAEALLVAGIGVLLASVATALNLAGLLAALNQLVTGTSIVIPWGTAAGFALGAVLFAVLGSVATAAAGLRGRPTEQVGARE